MAATLKVDISYVRVSVASSDRRLMSTGLSLVIQVEVPAQSADRLKAVGNKMLSLSSSGSQFVADLKSELEKENIQSDGIDASFTQPTLSGPSFSGVIVGADTDWESIVPASTDDGADGDSNVLVVALSASGSVFLVIVVLGAIYWKKRLRRNRLARARLYMNRVSIHARRLSAARNAASGSPGYSPPPPVSSSMADPSASIAATNDFVVNMPFAADRRQQVQRVSVAGSISGPRTHSLQQDRENASRGLGRLKPGRGLPVQPGAPPSWRQSFQDQRQAVGSGRRNQSRLGRSPADHHGRRPSSKPSISVDEDIAVC